MAALYTYLIEIDLLSTANIPELGVTNGIARWTTETVAYSEPTVKGILRDTWIKNIGISADLRRGGRFASLPRVTITTLFSKKIISTLIEQNIPLYGKRVTISIIDSTLTATSVYVGTVSKAIDGLQKGSKIEIEGLSAVYNTPLNRQIADTDNFYPVTFGDLPQSLLAAGNNAGVTTPIDAFGLPYTFYMRQAVVIGTQTLGYFQTATNGSLTTDQIKDDYAAAFAALLQDQAGYLKGVSGTGEDQYFAVDSLVLTQNTGATNEMTFRLRLVQVHPTPDLGGFTESGTIEPQADTSFCVFVQSPFVFYSDPQDTINPSAGVFSFVDDQYRPVPERGNSIKYTDTTATLITGKSGLTGDTKVTAVTGDDNIFSPLDYNSFVAAGIGSAWAFNQLVLTGKPYNPKLWTSVSGSISSPTPDYFLLEAGATAGIKIDVSDFEITESFDIDQLFLTGFGGLKYKTLDNFDITIGVSVKRRWGEEVIGYYSRTIDYDEFVWFESSEWFDEYGEFFYDYNHLNNNYDNTEAFYRKTFTHWSHSFNQYPASGDRPNGDGYNYVDIGTLKDKDLGTTVDLVVWLTFSGVREVIFRDVALSDLSVAGVYSTADADNLFAKTTGRKDELDQPITTAIGMYKSVVRHQNLKTFGYSAPLGGWGLNEPSQTVVWSDIYDDSNVYGGFGYAGIPDIEIAKQYQKEITTDKVKDELLRAMWCLGSHHNGVMVEKIFPMLEAFAAETTGIAIDYGMIKGEITADDLNYSDVFAEVAIDYAYDAATNKGSKHIAITNTENEAFLPDYVTGVTDILEAEELWKMGRAVYLAYGGVKNTYPNKDQSIIKNEADAIEHIRQAYRWQGYRGDTVYKRYTATFTVDATKLVADGIYQGSQITLTDPDIAPNGHKGLAEKATLTPRGGTYKIVAQMLSDQPVVSGTTNWYEGQNGVIKIDGQGGDNRYEGVQ